MLHVEFSHWLLVLTLLLALFLATAKRRAEYVALAGDAASHRPSLEHYSLPMLDQMLSVVMACTLLAYAFYTISPETVTKFGTDHLLMTFPLPIYGLFRYLYLIHRGDGGGNPSDCCSGIDPLQLMRGVLGRAGRRHHLRSVEVGEQHGRFARPFRRRGRRADHAADPRAHS